MAKSKDSEAAGKRLQMWQDRIAKSNNVYDNIRTRMDEREEIYRGRKEISKIIDDDAVSETACPWNIIYEIIETEVDSNIPQPKINPLRKEDEKLARMIEDLVLNKIDELPMELINDETERTVPKQGGSIIHAEWDNDYTVANRSGRSTLAFVHPKNIIPQPGVVSDIEDMDWCGIAIGVTKSSVKRRWGVDVSDEAEEKPELRGPGDVQTSDDMVTVHLIYFRNENGGIGKYVYCNDTELEYFEDYQSRRNKKCAKCGRAKQLIMSGGPAMRMEVPTLDGTYPGGGEWEKEEDGVFVSEDANIIPDVPVDENTCPWCGGTKWVDGVDDYQEVWQEFDVEDDDGNVLMHIPGQHEETDEDGNTELVPTKIPYYVPNVYPLVLIKNVSSWGQLLGESDVDKIEGQQNAINRLQQKLLDSVLKGGSVLTVPEDPNFSTTNGVSRVYRLESAAEKEKFGVFNLEPSTAQTVSTMNFLYEQARNTIGITDSFQGRQDATAQSGAAKQYSAAQAAGRFASKRVMKRFGWSRIFELLFKFELAYSDEKRPIIGRDKNGVHRDETWDRWRFLRQDADGNFYWNTDFLFSADIGNTLESDRPALWRELYEYYASGVLGDKGDISTQILFWRMLEHLHYPHAADVKEQLIERQQSQSELSADEALEQLKALEATGGAPRGGGMQI